MRNLLVLLLAALTLIGVTLFGVAQAPQQDQCPAYLELTKSMIADREVTIEIQRRQLRETASKLAEAQAELAKRDGK